MLISQFAGTSAHKNVKKMSNEQIDYHNETQEKKIIFGKTHEIIEQEYKKLKTGEYVEKLLLLDMDKPYSMNIRLLPFLTSYGRIKTAKLAIKDLDNVIRINTDNVTFLKEQIFETNIKNKKKLYVKHIEGTKHNMLHLETLKPEEKTTGLIEFKKKGYKHIEKVCGRSSLHSEKLSTLRLSVCVTASRPPNLFETYTPLSKLIYVQQKRKNIYSIMVKQKRKNI